LTSNDSEVIGFSGGPLTSDSLDFLALLWRVEHVLQRASKSMLARQGITGPQRLVVRLIGINPGIGAGDLARLLHHHPSTLTGVLQRLEEKRLILRDIDPNDRRRARFTLTAAGRAIDGLHEGTIEASVAAVLPTMDPADLSTTARALSTLAEAIERDLG
jgi:DNA-binding MarR family transcriptional regulator